MAMKIRFGDQLDYEPESRSYKSENATIAAILTRVLPDKRDKCGQTFSVVGEPFFAWHERLLANRQPGDRKELEELFCTGLVLSMAGYENVDLHPIPQRDGEPDVEVRFADGTVAYVEVTRAEHPQDSERQRLIREIQRLVIERIGDGRLIDCRFDFAFHDCPAKRDLEALADKITALLCDHASWPSPGETFSPDWLRPYGYVTRLMTSKPGIQFATDALGIPRRDLHAVKLNAIAAKVRKTYVRQPLWLVVNGHTPGFSEVQSLYNTDVTLGGFERIFAYTGDWLAVFRRVGELAPTVETP
jgi:hypothetical protein